MKGSWKSSASVQNISCRGSIFVQVWLYV